MGLCYTNSTGSVCYKSVKRTEDNNILTSFQCVQNKAHFYVGLFKPLVCRGILSMKHDFVVDCCFDRDGCNIDIALELSEDQSKGNENS